jgi:hypothetical protein
MATTTTTMTAAEFLASNPRDHADFVSCDDPRLESRLGRAGSLLLPNLVGLIRRIGGPDAIPDQMEEREPDGFFHWQSEDRWNILIREGQYWSARLKDCHSSRVYAELSRLGNGLEVREWHPHERYLGLIFTIPVDWSASAWAAPTTMIEDIMSASHDLDLLAAEACDLWIEGITKSVDTYIDIRRDQLVF